jgi:hypothetical protein
LCLSYGRGPTPPLLRAAGLPSELVTARWSNPFLGYGLIESRLSGGIILGELAIASLFGLQYLIILIGCIAPTEGRRAPRCIEDVTLFSPPRPTPLNVK